MAGMFKQFARRMSVLADSHCASASNKEFASSRAVTVSSKAFLPVEFILGESWGRKRDWIRNAYGVNWSYIILMMSGQQKKPSWDRLIRSFLYCSHYFICDSKVVTIFRFISSFIYCLGRCQTYGNHSDRAEERQRVSFLFRGGRLTGF